jgi:cyclopropane fatty-acyl-phospholipid synthase-like methyltransferase
MTDLADTIIDHYEKHALAWEADRRNSGWNDKLWHDRFVAGLPAKGQVLDLGCGGGDPVACHLHACGLRITGVDSSSTMISLCRQRLADHEWIVADMRRLSLSRRFDGILAWDSFFHLDYDSQRAMFAVFAAHASSGAMLMFNAGPRHGEAIGNYRGDPLYHASLAPDEYRALIDRTGFETIDHAVEDAQAGGRTVWLCRAK